MTEEAASPGRVELARQSADAIKRAGQLRDTEAMSEQSTAGGPVDPNGTYSTCSSVVMT